MVEIDEMIQKSRRGERKMYRSRLCTQEEMESDRYREVCELLGTPTKFHRKQWEFCFVLGGLEEEGILDRYLGSLLDLEIPRGLGFGVGREPIPQILWDLGMFVIASDLPAAEAGVWGSSGQHAAGFQRGYEPIDMRNIDPFYRDGSWDFVWSCSSLEHLGSLGAGIQFIHHSLECLKVGGIGLYTTEILLDDREGGNGRTLDRGDTVIYRNRDLELFASGLHLIGYEMELDLRRGNGEIDRMVDREPYRQDNHLSLNIQGFVATSVGLCIRRIW